MAALRAQATALQGINIGNIARGVVAPKFQWDEGLRQTDQLVKNIQKAKLSVTEFRDIYRNRVDDIVTQQARLSRAFSKPLGNGTQAIIIPSANDMHNLVSQTELANRKLSAQSEILRGLGTKVQDWGKNTQWAGRQMMVGMTVPFAMAAGVVGMYANKIDSAMVKVEKVYNGSLDGFREKALSTSKDVVESMGQSVESTLEVMGKMAAAGKSGQALMDVTKQTQLLSTLGDIPQEDSIKGIISLQSMFNMNTKDLADTINYLNSVEDQTSTSMQDLIDALPIAGAQVSLLGGTVQDATVLLTAFRERGIATVEGANAIKTAMSKILSPTKAVKNMFQDLTGQSLTKLVESTEGKPLETFQAISDAIMGGNIALDDQQRLITKLVGIYQSSRITGLLSELQKSTGAVAVTKGISDESPEQWAARTAKSLKAITESASGQWKIAVESFKLQLQPIGEIALKVGTAIVKAFSKALEIFNAIPEPIQKLVLGITALVAIAGPISMIVGIFANFMGTIIKTGAFMMGMRGKYKSMTLEQKAAELSAGNLNASMMTQAETTQVLIYQLDKLRAAYTQVGQAAAATPLLRPTPPGIGGNMNVSGVMSPGMTGLSMPIGGMPISQVGPVSQLNQGLQQVGQQQQKNSMLAKAFNSEVLLGVGMVAQLGSMVSETGSGWEKWLNYISLAAVGLSAIMPIITKIGTAMKAHLAGGALSALTSKLGNTAKGFGSKVLSGGKAAFTGLASFITGPWGLAVGASIAAIWGITKLINAKTEEQRRHQSAIVNSTNEWASILGKTKLEWGQIRDDSGEVKDNIDSIANKMREKMPDLVNELSGAGPKYLQQLANREVLKLQGQGLSKEEIMNNMNALLVAAGRTKKEIDTILGNIKVNFDFVNGEKDINAFLKTTRGDIQKELNNWMFDMPVRTRTMGDRYGDERSEQMDQTAERMKGLFIDRLAGLDPELRAVFAKKFASDMNKGFEESFEKLEREHGSDIAKNWKDAKAKFFNWDADENRWMADKGATSRAGLSESEVHQMEIQIDAEQRLTQAIARGLHIDEEKAKKMSIIGDILPYITKEYTSAIDTQKSYNKVVEDAKKSGHEMTKEEKLKLAQLYAVTYGLDAATLANNGYSDSNNKAKDNTYENKKALQEFLNVLNGAPGAVEEFWGAFAAGEGGFVDALGGDPAAQAQQLTDQVKGIYSGAMNDIYSAMAAQAEQQWQARMDGITASFERRREALQDQVKRLDKSWDEKMEQTSKAYENRQKAIEDSAESEIEAIEKQIDMEQDREDARQRQFEAEKKRIERLTELANRNIDYNRALATGNLDEAARVMNNTESLTVGWGASDAQERSSLLSKDQVDQLSATKELVQKQRDAKLEALKAEEEAVRKSMESQREMERERLQNRLDSLSKEQSATEQAERRKQDMNRRTLEIELATLKAFIPQNEQQLAEHVGRISSAYANYGINLQTAGGYWGTIIGNALSNNVNRARQEMSNNAAWAAFGSSVAGAISQGAFGLSLSDFFTLIATGQPPAGWTPPGVKNPTPGTFQQRPGGRIFYHTGGEVGADTGGRPGRSTSSPLGGDEVPTILQRGEFVFPKSAVQLYGSDYLKKLAAGTPPVQQDNSSGIGGMFGSMMGAMGHSLIGLVMNNLMTWAMQQYGGGGGSGAAVDFAKAQDGKPYIWGGVGPAGYDCSGYMSAIANVLVGAKSPYKRIFSTGMAQEGKSFGPFVPGLGGLFEIGVKHGNPGHTAGTLMGVPVESTGDHVRYGKDASYATDKQFTMHFHIPDDKIAAGAAIPGMGTPSGEPGTDKAQQRVKNVAAGYGWSNGEQWAALYALIQKESSWNPNAANPTSSARGLFQKMTSIHGPLESTIEGQAQWGLNYIKSRYGDPIKAWAFHKRKGWYDSGGDIHPGFTGILNGTGKTETIVTHDTRKEITMALDNAAISYKKFELAAKTLNLSPVASNVAPGSGDTYNNYKVDINGSGLSQHQLEVAIKNGIEKAEADKAKRLGKRK